MSVNTQKDPPLTLNQRIQNSRSELNKRNAEVIAKFLEGYVEPLLKVQAISGLSKIEYCFIPSGTKQKELTKIVPENKNIVEGFNSRSKKTDPCLSTFKTKEYIKVIRLIGQEYGLEFWQQPTVMQDLEKMLKSRLQANGEKLAETTRNSAGRSWHDRSFHDGEKLSRGYTGVELRLHAANLNPRVKFIKLYAEFA